MFTLFISETFAAAHRLDRYHGKCEALHGHNFRVEALIEGKRLNSEGMLVDFAVLKARLREVVAELDHGYINDLPFFRERASSSEYLAFYIYGRLVELMGGEGAVVREVRVWESDHAYAAYGG
jgi:6-pyruvoyltetrahydropterin/6-carboxytetrahydropterin synthase